MRQKPLIQFNKKIGRSATGANPNKFTNPIQFNKKIGRSATKEREHIPGFRIQFNKKIGRSATTGAASCFGCSIQFNKKIGRSATIKDYTNNLYGEINEALFKQQHEKNPQLKNAVEQIDNMTDMARVPQNITFPVVNDGLPIRIRACGARLWLANCGGVRRGSERSNRPNRTEPEPTKRLQSYYATFKIL